MNTDQGSQFTSIEFIKVLKDAKTKMDGKGTWRDQVLIERLWRTIKCGEVYLNSDASVSEARKSIRRYLGSYNVRRPYSLLGGQTLDQAPFNTLTPISTAV